MQIATKEHVGFGETLAQVLVASADRNRLRDLSSRLGARGYVTLPATPSVLTLKRVRDTLPDVVIVEADGDNGAAIALAEGVKATAETRHIPVAIVARQAPPLFRRACVAAGIDDVIIGGVPDAVLVARLAPLLRLAAMTRELQHRSETLATMGHAAITADPAALSHEPRIMLLSAWGEDDEPSDAVRALAESGDVTLAGDEFAAADMLGRDDFDALVVPADVADGAERALRLCTHIRNNPRLFNLPILVTAGPDSFADPALPYLRGATMVLSRPYDPTELRDQVLSLVRRQLFHRRTRQALRATLMPLTGEPEAGLFSPLFLARHLNRLVEVAGLTQKPLSVVLFEIQNMSWFERLCGPESAERVLTQAGRRIAEQVRVEDLPARVDATSIAVVMPNTRAADALIAAHRVAGALSNTEFPAEQSNTAEQIRLWLGTGVAAAEPGDTVGGLIERARTSLR